ncbi:MAG: hypothetical protein V9G04_18630 [Nocardioides sp.]
MRRLLALLLFAGTLVLWTPGVSYACSCAEVTTVKERVRLADAVFVGTVSDTREADDRVRYLVEVGEDFGQQLPKRVIVTSQGSDAMCGLPRVEQSTERIWFTEIRGQRLDTNLCLDAQSFAPVTVEQVAAAIGPEPPSLAGKVKGTDHLSLQLPTWKRWASLIYALVLTGGLVVFVVGHRYRARRARRQQPPTV